MPKATEKKTTKATKTTKPTKAVPKAKAIKKIVDSDLANEGIKEVKGFGTGFITFIREQGIIGLAVGLAIGTAAGASVKVIVNEFISPLVALITQGIDLNSLKWVLVDANAKHAEVAIGWGAIVSSMITLIATAFVIYWLVHVAKLDRLDKKKGA